jgi:general stress protein YciG
MWLRPSENGSSVANCSQRRFVVGTQDRGFASMDRDKQRNIASKGGRAAHQKGTAHEWTSEEAREAGRRGGIEASRRKRLEKTADIEQQPSPVNDSAGSGGYTPL